MSSENINRFISSDNEEHNCSDDEETESGIWTKAGPLFLYWAAGCVCQSSEN